MTPYFIRAERFTRVGHAYREPDVQPERPTARGVIGTLALAVVEALRNLLDDDCLDPKMQDDAIAALTQWDAAQGERG
jgi:hypothetical protein